MKVALSTSVIQRGRSGVARYVFELIEAILRRPDSPELILLVLTDDIPLFERFEGRVRIVPVSEKWRHPLLNIFWHQFLLPGWLRRERIDLLHVPSYRRMVAYAPCATVATIHDLAPFRVAEKYDLARMFYGRYVARFLARRQDAILTVSQHTADDIARFFGISRDRIRIAWNGLDKRRFHSTPEPGNSDTPDTPYFLYVSRLEHPAKNHVRLIDAFNRFRSETDSDWRLVLGGSDWHGAEIIREHASRSPYAASIEFPGFVSDEALPDLYRNAGALVYPSLFEGFGMPPIEAMACGCPVICSDRGSLPEVVGDAALLCDPEDTDTLADTLRRVSGDEKLQQTLSAFGISRTALFDWGETARITIETWEATLGGPPFGGIESTLGSPHLRGNRNSSHVLTNCHQSPSPVHLPIGDGSGNA